MYPARRCKDGKDGEQGQRGEPSKECLCMYRMHKANTAVRFITSKGRRTLSLEDDLVIVDCVKSCVFILPPDVPHVKVDSEDHTYYPAIIRIVPESGIHEVRATEGTVINGYLSHVELDKKRLYTFVYTPKGGCWVMY